MDEPDGSGFVFTDDMDYRAQVASIVGSSVSLALSVFIILASAWIYSIPSARHHLDRVSFRLLLWSMVMEVLYNAVYLYIFSDPYARTLYPTSCSAAVYFLLASMSAANWLCTSIGVNLMLAICFGINPVRARLERWYILLSLLIGFGITVIPAGLGDFGVDSVYEACYFTETDEKKRIIDFILDLYLWQILSSLIAAVSVLAVLITLLRQSRSTGRALFRANGLNITSQDLRDITSTSSTTPLDSLGESKRWRPRMLRRGASASSSHRGLHRLEDKFVTIALKISLYPLALILINAFITAEDLDYTIGGGVQSPGDYVLYCIYYFLYGGRGMFFALLGIFVDPCLKRGLPAAYRATFHQSLPVLPLTSADDTTDREKGATLDGGAEAESLTDFLSSPPLPAGEQQAGWDFGRRGEGSSWLGRSAQGEQRKGAEEVEEGDSAARPPLPLSILIASNPGQNSVSFSAPSTLPEDQISSSPAIPRPSLAPAPSPLRPPPPARTGSRQSWIQPLATAILTRTDSPQGQRRSSDPPIGDTFRRRRELRIAAEKMYAEVQAQL